MKKFNSYFLLLILFAAGCASLQEGAKVFWGSSTKALEKARTGAMTKTFSCTLDECFTAVLKFAKVEVEEEITVVANQGLVKSAPVIEGVAPKPGDKIITKRQNFDVFIKDRRHQRIVVMGVPGSGATTEVGIFFTPVEDKGTLLEITSLSSAAKAKVADLLFFEMGRVFKEIQ